MPGTNWTLRTAATASDAPIEKRMKAMNARGLNALDSGDLFFFIRMELVGFILCTHLKEDLFTEVGAEMYLIRTSGFGRTC